MEKSKDNMSKIDLQIKELQKKKTKIEAYDLISKKIKELLKDSKFKDVVSEVHSELSEFLNIKSQEVENGETMEKKAQFSKFDSEDEKIMKMMIESFRKKVAKINIETPSKKQSRKESIQNTQDKITFSLQHRHLEGKKATAYIDGREINGTITGLDAPNLILKTPTGKFVEASIDEVNVKG